MTVNACAHILYVGLVASSSTLGQKSTDRGNICDAQWGECLGTVWS